MLGWHISVFRQEDGGPSPAKAGPEKGVRIAVWQTGVEGLRWLDELVRIGHAIGLGGNGYPYYYTVQTKFLIEQIISGPPGARPTWVSDTNDVLTSQWEGKTVIDRVAVDACQPGEWLLVVAWDES